VTKIVKVEGDTRIDISFEDRKAQHDALMSIHKLYPAISAATRASDSIRKEIKKQESALKKIPGVPAVIHESIKAISKEIDDIRLKLIGDPKLGYRGMRLSVRGRFLMTGRSIGGYTGAPSEHHVKQIRKNSEELKTLIERINKIIEVDIPKLNELMNKNKIPRIFVGKKIRIS
jgi:cell division FtsZ-interacting protein ZapD